MNTPELTIKGDLNQISAQYLVITTLPCNIRQSNAHITIVGEDSIQLALTAFFNRETAGWHHYCKQYIEFGICSCNTEFSTKLSAVIHRQYSLNSLTN